MTDRGSIIKIGENDYELILTTRATKEIAKRYGGLFLFLTQEFYFEFQKYSYIHFPSFFLLNLLYIFLPTIAIGLFILKILFMFNS